MAQPGRGRAGNAGEWAQSPPMRTGPGLSGHRAATGDQMGIYRHPNLFSESVVAVDISPATQVALSADPSRLWDATSARRHQCDIPHKAKSSGWPSPQAKLSLCADHETGEPIGRRERSHSRRRAGRMVFAPSPSHLPPASIARASPDDLIGWTPATPEALPWPTITSWAALPHRSWKRN